jgi:hypothetical protein
LVVLGEADFLVLVADGDGGVVARPVGVADGVGDGAAVDLEPASAVAIAASIWATVGTELSLPTC